MRNGRARRGGRFRGAVNHLILIAGLIFLAGPIALIVASSTHDSLTLRTAGLQLWPGDTAIENYGQVLTLRAGGPDGVTAGAMLRNSLILGLGVGVLTTVFSLLSAYALVFFRWRLAPVLFWLIMVTLLFPIEARFIPTFDIAARLGLIDSHVGMILPTLAAALGTLFFRQLMRTVPEEMLEAARLDGAGPVRFLVDIIVPLALRRAGTVFVIAFMIGWNQYLWPIMVSTDDGMYTLMRGVELIGSGSGPGMALMVLTILPPFLLVLAFQRWCFRDLAG